MIRRPCGSPGRNPDKPSGIHPDQQEGLALNEREGTPAPPPSSVSCPPMNDLNGLHAMEVPAIPLHPNCRCVLRPEKSPRKQE